jgi:MoxR-like ATPase
VTIEQLAAKSEEILAELERAIVGKREALELVLLGVLADGHVCSRTSRASRRR